MPRKSKKKDTSSALAGTLAAFSQADAASPAINLTTPPSESEADKSTPATEPVADKPDSDPTPEPDTESTTSDAQSEPEPETVAADTQSETAPEPEPEAVATDTKTKAKSKPKSKPKPAPVEPEPAPESETEPAAESVAPELPNKKRFQLDLELLQAYEKWQQNFERSDYQPLNRKLFVALCQQGIIPPPPVDIYIASEKTRWAYARQALRQALRYHTATVLTTLVDLQKDE